MKIEPFHLQNFQQAIAETPPATREAALVPIANEATLQSEFDAAATRKAVFSGQACLVKDNFDVIGYPTKASSRFLDKERESGKTEGPLLRKIRETGLAVLGKTQMNEFAYGLDGANLHYGNCPHPGIPSLIPGGSSSGSAWAVGRGLVPIAFGTDTGGSVRVPSSFCGLYGIRLSPGDWATDGCFPLAPSLDAAGWMTPDANTLAFFTRGLLDLPESSNTNRLQVKSMAPLGNPFSQVAKNLFGDQLHPADNSPPPTSLQTASAFTILQSREAATVHEAWLDRLREEYDPIVFQRIARGREWTENQLSKAASVRTGIRSYFENFFQECDIALLPACTGPTPSLPMSEEFRNDLLSLNAPASLAGLPVVTIPIPQEDGTSMGLQCILPVDRWRTVLDSLLSLLQPEKS